MEQYVSKMAGLDDRLLQLNNAITRLREEKKVLETKAEEIKSKIVARKLLGKRNNIFTYEYLL